MTNVIARLAVT